MTVIVQCSSIPVFRLTMPVLVDVSHTNFLQCSLDCHLLCMPVKVIKAAWAAPTIGRAGLIELLWQSCLWAHRSKEVKAPLVMVNTNAQLLSHSYKWAFISSEASSHEYYRPVPYNRLKYRSLLPCPFS